MELSKEYIRGTSRMLRAEKPQPAWGVYVGSTLVAVFLKRKQAVEYRRAGLEQNHYTCEERFWVEVVPIETRPR